MCDYYEILQVHPKASFATIGKGYRTQIKKYHPDVNKARDARERTILINQAYAVLSDPVKREQYNREYFDEQLPESIQAAKTKVVLRPFLGWATILAFILADTLQQVFFKQPALISQAAFVLFLMYTAIRDSARSLVARVAWALGGYVLWIVSQGLATLAVWKFGMKAPGALLLISASQFPSLWFVMRRSAHFTKTVSYGPNPFFF